MTPLLVATGGFIPCGDPLKIATSGYIGSCVDAPVATVDDHRAGGYDALHGPDPYTAQALREDEEMLVILQAFIGAIDANRLH